MSACDNYRLAPGYRHTCVCGRPDSFHETVQPADSDGQLTTDGAPLLQPGAPSEPVRAHVRAAADRAAALPPRTLALARAAGTDRQSALDAAPANLYPAECSEATDRASQGFAHLAGAPPAGPATPVPTAAGPALSPTARAYRCGQLTAAIGAAIALLELDDGAATEEALALLRRELADTAWEAQ